MVMCPLLNELSEETCDRLRKDARATEDVDWPLVIARKHDWRVANQAYHAAQRSLGKSEMAALLATLGLRPPLEPARIQEALVAAIELYFRTDETAADARTQGAFVEVAITRCPIYTRFEQPGWIGLTACGCYSRVSGWCDAIGILRDLEVLENRKWGDPTCRTRLHLPGASAAAAAPGR